MRKMYAELKKKNRYRKNNLKILELPDTLVKFLYKEFLKCAEYEQHQKILNAKTYKFCYSVPVL